jgi:hypothetical protein
VLLASLVANACRKRCAETLKFSVLDAFTKNRAFTKVKSGAHYPNKKYLLSEQEIQDLLAFCNNILCTFQI